MFLVGCDILRHSAYVMCRMSDCVEEKGKICIIVKHKNSLEPIY